MRRSEKIYYDLTESDVFVELLNHRFYFSSSFNKERFLSGYESYIKEEEDKKNRFLKVASAMIILCLILGYNFFCC